jgi:small GTP-binding protein
MGDYDITLKFIIVGEASVGKTVLTKRYLKNEFIGDTLPTIGNDYFKQERVIDGFKTLIQFWDTAGQERYRAVSTKIYEDARAVLIVYDVTNRSSFQKVAFWHTAVLDKTRLKPTVMLVGNKIDLVENRVVSTEEGVDFAAKNGMLFMETSAKSNEGNCVQNAFDTVLNMVSAELVKEEREHQVEEERFLRSSVVPLDLKGVNSDKGCC